MFILIEKVILIELIEGDCCTRLQLIALRVVTCLYLAGVVCLASHFVTTLAVHKVFLQKISIPPMGCCPLTLGTLKYSSQLYLNNRSLVYIASDSCANPEGLHK